MTQLAAWWRRGWDAELLACAPDRDERGDMVVWDFPHPVNRSPLWHLLRPWLAIPVVAIAATEVLIGSVIGWDYWVADLPRRLATRSLMLAVAALAIRRGLGPKVERMALRKYRAYRWRATTTLDATIAAALERERAPRRLLDMTAPGGDR